VVIATKGGITRPGGRWERDGRPQHLREACERSLAALRVESIDLYQLHAPDPNVPLQESVGELARLRSEGKVQAIGLSNVSLEELRLAERSTEIASVQNRYNPWDRSSEASGLIEYCDRSSITFIPYSPVGGRRRVAYLRDSPALRDIGVRVGATAEELVLAWILGKSESLCPIPGASRVETVDSNVRAVGIQLDEDTTDAIELAFGSLPG
jgi:aryl-alcohol dehydrogenase-like predicted oxidoreductase